MEELIIRPISLSFVTTYKCTAKCRNCCFNCSPNQDKRLTLEDLKEMIGSYVESFPSLKLVVFTGGEPFTLGEDIYKAIEFVSSKNLLSRIVSNGYWATSYKKAFLVLQRLISSGLSEINFSTGDEHQEWVPFDNIVNGIKAAMSLSLRTAVNIEYHSSNKFNADSLRNDPRLIEFNNTPLLIITNGIWIYYNDILQKEGADYSDLNKSSLLQKPCDTMFTNININPSKQIFSCCGFASEKLGFLQLGNFNKEINIKELYFKQFDDFLKIWLYTDGPEPIAKFINEKLGNHKIDYLGVHSCELCEIIFKDANNIDILKKNYLEIFPNVTLKYMLKKRIHKEETNLIRNV